MRVWGLEGGQDHRERTGTTALANQSAAIAVVAHRDMHIASLSLALIAIPRPNPSPQPIPPHTPCKHGTYDVAHRAPPIRAHLSRAPQASGVGVSSECLDAFQELKLGKKSKYIVFTLNKSVTEIVVEKKGAPTSTYDDFLADLPEAECRWAVYDFDYEKEDGGKRSKITFYSW